MTETERVALAECARYLHLLRCDRCGGEWITAKTTTTLFHRCLITRGGGGGMPPPMSPRELIDQDRRRWAAAKLGALTDWDLSDE